MTICANPAACVGAQPETVLKSVFGYDSFRPLQKEIIANVLAGKDTLAVMPTGGGKSLCYQIPALIFDGLTVVVSPLIALMQDQVSALVSDGVNAVFLNSSLEWKDYCRAADSIRAGMTKLVYVSPEGLATQRMQELLHSDGVVINCITIDEAHCI
ncbi:MAG: DEAD/DEAH box helicase, partial [Treponema sp.]